MPRPGNWSRAKPKATSDAESTWPRMQVSVMIAEFSVYRPNGFAVQAAG